VHNETGVALPLLFACATVLFSCSPMQVAGGSDNPDFKVSGIIVDSLGNPVQHTIVKLIPANFNPETDAATHIVFDTTDSDGCYAFSTSRAGTYTILGANPLQSTKCYIPDVAIADAVTKIHEDTLRKTGAIRVIVLLRPIPFPHMPIYPAPIFGFRFRFLPALCLSIPCRRHDAFDLLWTPFEGVDYFNACNVGDGVFRTFHPCR